MGVAARQTGGDLGVKGLSQRVQKAVIVQASSDTKDKGLAINLHVASSTGMCRDAMGMLFALEQPHLNVLTDL